MSEELSQIAPSWSKILKDEFEKEYFQILTQFLTNERDTHQIYPPSKFTFEAFNRTSFEDVKVVILGQDPYHGPGQAHGLSFSVAEGVQAPPSLRNIFKELLNDIGEIPLTNNLSSWADQGVLLLNATLTVRAGEAGSHQNKGWEQFTDAVINSLSAQREKMVFVLWGSYAQKKGEMIDESKHMVLKSAHPSPFSAHRGFFGSAPFSKVNKYLKENKQQPINWS